MKAMILAAGRGQRMHSLTDHTPKPLLSIGPHTLLEHHLYKLANAGVQDVVINIAYLAEQIQRHIGNGQRYQLSVHWSDETQALESGGGIKKALSLLGDEAFCVINADVLTDWDYMELVNFTLRPQTLGHLFLVNNPQHHPKGDYCIHDQWLSNEGSKRYTFSGLSVLHPQLFDSELECYFKLASVFNQQLAHQTLSASVLMANWLDVGTPDRLAQAKQWMKGLSKSNR